MFRKLGLLLAVSGVMVGSTVTAFAKPTGPEIFKHKGCVQCHTVTAYAIDGKAVGPDLSIAYQDVETRHGMSLEKFLEKPAGMMQAIFRSAKLTHEEMRAIFDLLKGAASKQAKH